MESRCPLSDLAVGHSLLSVENGCYYGKGATIFMAQPKGNVIVFNKINGLRNQKYRPVNPFCTTLTSRNVLFLIHQFTTD
jgi:hypothetical protein